MVEIPTPIELNNESLASDWEDEMVAEVEGARVTTRHGLQVVELTATYPTALNTEKRCPIRIHRITTS
jgi:hypothetical protein